MGKTPRPAGGTARWRSAQRRSRPRRACAVFAPRYFGWCSHTVERMMAGAGMRGSRGAHSSGWSVDNVAHEESSMGSAASHPLDVFCGNLTLIARQGHFSGHPEYAAEIARTFQILARRYEPGQRQRQQCNPVFLDAGGGDRWHAVEGAVAALVQGVAPAALHGRVILTLDFAGLMAGGGGAGPVADDQ